MLSLTFAVMETALRARTPAALEQRMRKIEIDEMQEEGVRQTRRRRFKTMYADSKTIGYRLAANFESEWKQPEYNMRVKTNALGMRDREPNDEAASNRLRVLTLGDSFAFGLGVDADKTFQRLLEKRLQERYKRPIEVLNSGIPGYGTCQEEILLKELSPRLKPNLTILCFYMGNDLYDNLYCMESGVMSERVIDGAFVSNKRYHVKSDDLELKKIQNPIQRFLIGSSYAYNYIDQKISGFQMQVGLKPKTNTLFKSIEKFHCKQDGEEQEKVYALTKELFAKMRDQCKEQGCVFAVALFPAKAQITPELFDEQLRGFGVKEEDYSIDKPNLRLRRIAEELGIPAADLYEPFHLREKEPLYYVQDGHWTELGHRLAADNLYDFLVPLLPAQ